jgi:hypothetical protein
MGMEAFDTIRSYSQDAAARLREALEEAGPRLFTERVTLPYDLLLNAMPAEHAGFFDRLELYCRTPHALCVHGGLDPSFPDINAQPREALLWGVDGFPENYRGDELVVYGHWGDAPVDPSGWPHPRFGTRTVGLDSISKGVLTAIRLPGMEVIQSRRFRSCPTR